MDISELSFFFLSKDDVKFRESVKGPGGVGSKGRYQNMLYAYMKISKLKNYINNKVQLCNFNIKIYIHLLTLHVCTYMFFQVCTCVPWHACGSQSTACEK